MIRTLTIAAVLVAALLRTGDASQKPDAASPKPDAPAAKQGDPSGVYLCEGTNPDGHHYRGIVQIASVQNTFLVKWTLADDIEVLGVGIMQGDRLSVSYFGGTPAVVVYKVGADKLVGEWTMGGTEGKLYAETLTRVPEGSLPKPQPRRRVPPRTEPIGGNISI
jgi:hypothetical protein